MHWVFIIWFFPLVIVWRLLSRMWHPMGEQTPYDLLDYIVMGVTLLIKINATRIMEVHRIGPSWIWYVHFVGRGFAIPNRMELIWTIMALDLVLTGIFISPLVGAAGWFALVGWFILTEWNSWYIVGGYVCIKLLC